MLIGLGLSVLGWRVARHGQGGEVASLVEARDVVWGVGQAPIAVGTRLGPRDIRCASGTFKLVFDSGVQVALEGPADLRILSGMRILAVRGRITAHVDGRAKGFAIETPNTLVVDQGPSSGSRSMPPAGPMSSSSRGSWTSPTPSRSTVRPRSGVSARERGCASGTPAC